MAEQFRAGDVEALAIGKGRRAFFSRTSGALAELPETEAELLRSCETYRTFEEHARRWAARVQSEPLQRAAKRGPQWLRRLAQSAEAVEPSAVQAAEALATLERLAEAGFLERRSEIFAQAGALADDEPEEPVNRIGLPTRNRPEALGRALESFVGAFRRFERELDWLIVDDGRSNEEREATRAAVERAAEQLSMRVRYADRADRERYARRIADESGAPLETARFALLGDERCRLTTGAARNAVLLDATGERVLYTDDDALCRISRPPEPGKQLSLSSYPDPTRMWFFRSREELLEQVRFEPLDLVGSYERVLGRGAAALLTDVDPDAVDLQWMTPALERRLRQRPLRIRAAMAGVAGDSGIGATGYLFVAPENRARLLRDRAFYEAAVASRQLVRVAPDTTISDGAFCMAGNMGVDHRELAPPFTPVERNAEGGMARLLRTCFPSDCLGFLPLAVDHAPLATRRQDLEQWWRDLRRIRFSDAVRALIERSPGPVTENPARNLETLGERLEELAAGSAEAFERELRAGLLAELAPRLARDRARESESLPEYYRELRERQLEIQREALLSPGYTAPRDLLVGGRSEEEARGLCRELIGRFGAMLRAWPAMREAAAYLNAQGEGLGRR